MGRALVGRARSGGDRDPDATANEGPAATADDGPVATTDGGVDDGPGEHAGDDRSWSGDDPIAFDEDAGDDGAALLEALRDPTAPEVGSGDPAFGDSDATATTDSATGPAESDAGVSDPAGVDAGSDATEADRAADADGDDRNLADRVAALEEEQAALHESVADVRDETADIRSTLEDLGTDVDRLLTLAAGVVTSGTDPDPVGHTEGRGADPDPASDERAQPEAAGSSVGDPAEATDDGGDPVGGADEPEAVESPSATADGTPRPSDRTQPDEDAVAGLAAGTDGVSERGGDDEVTLAEEQARVDEAMGGPGGDGPAPRTGGDDRDARTLVDPTSDAVGAKLRRFQDKFDGDSAIELATGDGFQFRKVLLPQDGDGPPKLAGDGVTKPYLDGLPAGYAAEAAVIEWLDWLVSETDRETAARAIAYYDAIDWVSGDVADALVEYLEGVGSVESPHGAVGPPDGMDLEEHLRSLQYVTALASGEVSADGV